MDYQQPKVLVINNNSKEEEKSEQVILDNKIKINSLDNEDDIKIKKIGDWKLIKKHYSLNKDRVAL